VFHKHDTVHELRLVVRLSISRLFSGTAGKSIMQLRSGRSIRVKTVKKRLHVPLAILNID
jgi:hypothetical protein